MNILKSLALVAAGLTVTGSVAFSQTVYTTPSGYVTIDLQPGFNPIGVNVHNAPVISGQIDSENGATLTDADVDFSTVLTDANATYLLEINDGPAAGTVAEIDSNTATTVTVGGAVGAGTASYSIREAMTLTDIFGEGDDLKITGGFTSTSADTVFLPDGEGGYDSYFYSTRGNGFVLTSAPFATPTPVVAFYPNGIIVQVESNDPAPFQLFGELKTTPTAVSTVTGFTLLSIPSPVGQTLASSNLQSFLSPGFTSTAADVLYLPDGMGDYDEVFFSSRDNVWRLTSSPFAGDLGSREVSGALIVERKGSETSGVFSLPQFIQNL